MEYRAKWNSGCLNLITNSMPDIDDGEVVFVTIERQRSAKSHRHEFAWVNDAWANLPEAISGVPWAETADTLRKHALIATGFHQSYTLDCGKEATARRVLSALRGAEAKAHGYAIGRVRGPIVTIWTPESQSYRSMGADRFRESKNAILEWISAQIGASPSDLLRSSAA